MMPSYPILYSFRRCPYAMRARMALYTSNIAVELREVNLANKPVEMLAASSKGTVPVLVTTNEVIDESIDIIRWALSINDPQGWLSAYSAETISDMDLLIVENDTNFKQHLDHYKYADRFPEFSEQHYREQGEIFLDLLEQRLKSSSYLFSEQISFADIAIFPFVRQFASVDKVWFEESPYTRLQRWLQSLIASNNFISVMAKFPNWESASSPIIFSADP